MENKKTGDEWLVMRYFIEKWPEFPAGKLVKHESPDFLLRLNRRSAIGIELTAIESPGAEAITSIRELLHQLDQAISKKESRTGLYRKAMTDQLWLIVTTALLDLPANAMYTQVNRRNLPASSFDRIFLFDLFKGKVVEVENVLQ